MSENVRPMGDTFTHFLLTIKININVKIKTDKNVKVKS